MEETRRFDPKAAAYLTQAELIAIRAAIVNLQNEPNLTADRKGELIREIEVALASAECRKKITENREETTGRPPA